MGNYRIVEDDLTGPEVAALLELHLGEMHQWSPACKVHAMPIERLRQPDVTFYSAWDGDTLAAVGALKDLGDKVSSEDKLEVENKVSSLREALKGSDIDAIRSGMGTLAETLQRVSTAAYQASAAGGDAGDGAEGGEPTGEGAEGGEPAGEETVEGEYKEV